MRTRDNNLTIFLTCKSANGEKIRTLQVRYYVSQIRTNSFAATNDRTYLQMRIQWGSGWASECRGERGYELCGKTARVTAAECLQK